MVNLGALNWFDSFIKKLKKKIGLYQPCDLYTWIGHYRVFLQRHFFLLFDFCYILLNKSTYHMFVQ